MRKLTLTPAALITTAAATPAQESNVRPELSAIPDIKSRTRNDVGLSLGLAYHFR